MPSHVFISYAHHDREATEHLAQLFDTAGIRVWFDRRIETGAKWEQMIEAAIDACFAMAVLMSSAAEVSEWVRREIDRAVLLARPVLPLLLDGRPFPNLQDLQYESMSLAMSWQPSKQLVDRLLVLQSAALSRRRLRFCVNCRKQFLPEENPYCSYHP